MPAISRLRHHQPCLAVVPVSGIGGYLKLATAIPYFISFLKNLRTNNELLIDSTYGS